MCWASHQRRKASQLAGEAEGGPDQSRWAPSGACHCTTVEPSRGQGGVPLAPVIVPTSGEGGRAGDLAVQGVPRV